MVRDDVAWHGDSWNRLSRYQFNTKQKDQLFCGHCGASIGIDFRDSQAPRPSMFGISVRLDPPSPSPCPPTGVMKPARAYVMRYSLTGPATPSLQVRTFNGIDLEALEYKPLNGSKLVAPAEDLSGIWYEQEEKDRVAEKEKEDKQKEDEDEKELAAAAQTA